MIRIGIADCYGLESYFLAKDAKVIKLRIRAMANRQRHAVVYKAKIDSKADGAVGVLLEGKDYIGALKALKENAKDVELIMSDAGSERSWGMIPDPKLDPCGV